MAQRAAAMRLYSKHFTGPKPAPVATMMSGLSVWEESWRRWGPVTESTMRYWSFAGKVEWSVRKVEEKRPLGMRLSIMSRVLMSEVEEDVGLAESEEATE